MEWVISVSCLSGGKFMEYRLLGCARRGEPDPEMMQQSRKESVVASCFLLAIHFGFGGVTSSVPGVP